MVKTDYDLSKKQKPAKAPKPKRKWKWKLFKYTVVPAAMVSAGFVMGASYGAHNKDSWPVKFSDATIEYTQKAGNKTWEFFSTDIPSYFSGKDEDEDKIGDITLDDKLKGDKIDKQDPYSEWFKDTKKK